MLTRRDFVLRSGLAAFGAGLTLRAAAEPTPAVPDSHGYVEHLLAQDPPMPPEPLSLTEKNILGPYHRPGAPYRAKITPPLEPGAVLVICGRVWGHDTKKPLPGAVLDIWQADAKGRYDNDDRENPPAPGQFKCRARVMADETGYYEYETIHPAPYQTGPNSWRPSHIHYWIRHPQYEDLVTQLYFKGDPLNDKDTLYRPALEVDPKTIETPQGAYKTAVFDVVLPAKPSA